MRFPETLLTSEMEEEEELNMKYEEEEDAAPLDIPPTSESGEVEELLDERLILEDDEMVKEEVQDIIVTKQEQIAETLPKYDEVIHLGPWPEIPRAQAQACAQRVEEIKSTFQDDVDMWDTTMVSEYSDEILQYMGELEIQTMPNPDYLDTQVELTTYMLSASAQNVLLTLMKGTCVSALQAD